MINQPKMARAVATWVLGACLMLAPCYAQKLSANELQIPLLERAPEPADFEGMQPNSDLARAMVQTTGFYQRAPYEGEPASERTQVYLGYDSQKFFAVFLVFDGQPKTIRHSMAPREEVSDDDTVSLLLDTFNDQRRAYVFTCNARGVQRDGIYVESVGEDRTFHTVWDSQGMLTDQGFMVLMAIPFRSLRFPAKPVQEWGVMFSRNIVRLSEDVHWPGYLRSVQGRLNQAGRLRFETKGRSQTNYQFLPYVASRSFKVLDTGNGTPGFIRDDDDHKAGADGKIVFRESLVLDLTANPDFSQVESDAPQVTVNNRFELNFPELRPFFTENADIFRTPINLAFTRRIGEPEVGARLTGKVGKTTIGALLINDTSRGDRLSPDDVGFEDNANHGIFRFMYDLPHQGHLGVFYSHTEFAGDRAQVYSLDGRFRLNQKWFFDFQTVRSNLVSAAFEDDETGDVVPALRESDSATRMRLRRQGNYFTTTLRYINVGEDFGSPLAFLGGTHRPDNRSYNTFSTYRWRPENMPFNAWGFNLQTDYIEDQAGQELDEIYNPGLVFEGAGRTTMFLYGRRRWETLRPGDLAGVTELTTLRTGYWGISLDTAVARTFSTFAFIEFGEDTNYRPARSMSVFNGDSLSFYGQYTWRPISPLRIDQEVLYYRLDDQMGRGEIVSQRTSRLTLGWQFNRRLRLRFIGDYSSIRASETLSRLSRSRGFNGDVLFTYQVNPWTAFYLGYNGNYDNRLLTTDEDGPRIIRNDDLQNNANQVFFKFSYLVD